MRRVAGWLGEPDGLSGAAIVVVGGFLFWQAVALPFGSLRAPDSGFFPICLAAALVVLGLVLTVRAAFRALPGGLPHSTWSVGVAFVAFLLYGFVLERVGFILATVAVLIVMMRVYGRIGWGVTVAIAVGGVAVTYVLFRQLGVPLPAGVLWFV